MSNNLYNQCPYCAKIMCSLTEYSNKGTSVIYVCDCGYSSKQRQYDNIRIYESTKNNKKNNT